MTARMIGAALLVAAGALLGHERTAAIRGRAQTLHGLCAALGRMQSELCSLQTPLPQIFQRLRDCPFFSLLALDGGRERVEKLWCAAAQSIELDAKDRDALVSLAPVVGRYPAERQAAEIGLVRQQLEESAAQAEQELRSRARSFTGLGAAFGAMLAVLLF